MKHSCAGGRSRMPGARVLALVALLAAAVSAGLTGVAPSAARARAAAVRQVPGVLAGLHLARLLQAAPANRRLSIGVGIARPDTAGELALYHQLYDRSSPLYHHFLTPAQFQARFGVTPATTAAVRGFLTSGGLSITSASAGGDLFTATGTVAQLDRLFRVRIGDYAYRGRRFLANDVAPWVPANLPIDAVVGLESLTHFGTAALSPHQVAGVTRANATVARARRLLIGARRGATARPALGLPITVSKVGTEQTYTPQDLWGLYDAPGAGPLTNADGLSTPATVAASRYTLGQGQIMGVFTEGDDSSVIKNLRLFEATTGLPKVPVRIVETEGVPDSAYSDNSGAIEWYLDSQSSTAMAPDVKQLDLFTAKTFGDPDVAKEFDFWANDAHGPREMNASFGECEQNPTLPITGPLGNLPAGVALGGMMESLADPALRQATMEGRTLFASAGDTGSGCPTLVAPIIGAGNGIAIQPVPFQNYPCVSDYVVCVGGTTPSSKGAGYPAAAQRANEQAWTYTGGGSSFFNPAPDYQRNVANLNTRCVSNDTGTTVYAPGTAPLCRGVPDVADMSGGGNDWFFFYQDGEPSIEGGTSLSSPLMMGQWARVQAAAAPAAQNRGGLGFANETIYRQAASADRCTTAPCGGTYARDFFDITQAEDIGDVPGGQTGVTLPVGVGLSNGAYAPGPGWDYTTGWGAINDANFIQDVDGTQNAALASTGQERPAVKLCRASMTSPLGNATDAVTSTNDPGLDLSGASLSTQGSNIVATLTVPKLSAGLPPTALAGARFIVAWSSHGEVYDADAEESAGGAFSYHAENTGMAFAKGLPQNNQYTDTATVTGSVDRATGTITITVPAADVGNPPAGALLSDPQAFSQEQLAVLSITVDSADSLRGASRDAGQLDSIGADVVMGGKGCANTLPATSLSTAQTGVLARGATPRSGSGARRAPTTAITHTAFSRERFGLAGTARAFDGHRVTRVEVAIARVVRRHGRRLCAFLTRARRFSAPGGCRPRDYLAARGRTRWTFAITRRFAPGVYFLWEKARDSAGLSTRNVAARHVFIRVR
ncbi:MAG TPA: S53 family peptidase [Solirubrobacteraceae bacterium]|nr:S53 family peptidase [Solirubrobacteraceae bacterium]